MAWDVIAMPCPLYLKEREPVPILQEAGWDPGPLWMGAENIALTVIRSPDCPSRRGSLYRLRYSGPLTALILYNVNISMDKYTKSV
jgi:hypothetical protein